MSHEFFKKFRKLWNTGNYSSASHLYREACKQFDITDESTKQVVRKVCDNLAQGNNGTTWLYK